MQALKWYWHFKIGSEADSSFRSVSVLMLVTAYTEPFMIK